MGDPQTRY